MYLNIKIYFAGLLTLLYFKLCQQSITLDALAVPRQQTQPPHFQIQPVASLDQRNRLLDFG